MKLQAIEHLQLKPNAHKRVIDPNTGFQYEISSPEVNYICPICSHIQAAPAVEDFDYACPKCEWRYKLIGDLLVLWHPSSVGVELPAAHPGYNPFADKVVDAGGELADPARAAGAQEYATEQWLKARANNEGDTFGLKIQAVVPGKADSEDDDLPIG
jgi:DNA-directed RNA polymerase subunit RPC12/RpoP